MTKSLDLLGRRFGTLTVIKMGPNTGHSSRTWIVRCDCGVEKGMRGENLMSGNSKNCGCERQYHKTHGKSKTVEYYLFHHAKIRAKKKGIPFNLELSDIVVPEYCPVLPHIKLNRGNQKLENDSPTIDKLIPNLGYVKGNVRVVSWRANNIKCDASWQELMSVATWLKGELNAR
ncbi:MAG: hypothetical protein ABSE80_12945 [Halobacteriota archaeon]|jgi:hypothetical protein